MNNDNTKCTLTDGLRAQITKTALAISGPLDLRKKTSSLDYGVYLALDSVGR